MSLLRTRWAALGAAVAVTLGAGGIGLVDATKGTGDRAVYTAIEPCRLLDTRPNHGIGGRYTPLGAGESYRLDAHGSNGQCTDIPTDTTAVGLNITAVFPSQLTHLTVYPDGAVPNASSLNPAPGQPPTPNAVTTQLAGDGSFRIYNHAGSVHVIVDVVGIYQDHHHDDRYGTDKIIPVDLRALFLGGGAYQVQGGSSWTGVGLDDTGSPRFDFTFRLPANYVPGDTVTTEIWWHTGAADCTTELNMSGSSLVRPGRLSLSVTLAPVGLLEPGSIPAGTVRRLKWVVNPSSTDFEPGDVVFIDFTRNTADECSNTVIIDHIFIDYG